MQATALVSGTVQDAGYHTTEAEHSLQMMLTKNSWQGLRRTRSHYPAKRSRLMKAQAVSLQRPQQTASGCLL